ncbi:hypothetical protein DUNSADRAFT_8496 [Dunaliella salina]|uniref:Odorant receptor n=1 Tax=Dunaliella salina TaxID=3046 RepID=A0ABQ7GJD9_DUNSA|nr:hypothetical protein DUNSADRAFT_8496 [Dunaliella salina]|eukprot:KAF5834726.1 hypothetical protein DUNSADRAFT_8496 [Dunaliella salina]
MQDLDALEHGEQELTGIVWLYDWLKDKFDLAVLWMLASKHTACACVWVLNAVLLFFGLSIFGSALYIYDIYTDFVVATKVGADQMLFQEADLPAAGNPNFSTQTFATPKFRLASSFVFMLGMGVCDLWILLDNDLVTEAGVVLVFILFHHVVISFMLGVKFYYHFEARVINTIDRLTFPWDPKSRYSIHDTVQQQEVDAFLKSLTSSTVQLSSRPPQNTTMVETTQYETLRVPSRSYLESLPQTAYQGYLYANLRKDNSLNLDTETLAQSIALSIFNAAKNTIEIWIAYKCTLLLSAPYSTYTQTGWYLQEHRGRCTQAPFVMFSKAGIRIVIWIASNAGRLASCNSCSLRTMGKLRLMVSGFSFWSYVNNAILFEGAATLPFRWNAKRSSMLDRLVLGGDFYTLAHAQKMKLFQAALQHRKSITITTEEAKALGEECVVVASSLTMLEFIANMLPVSLSEQHASSAAIHIDITDIKNLPWRDDGRTISRERALKVLFNMHE